MKKRPTSPSPGRSIAPEKRRFLKMANIPHNIIMEEETAIKLQKCILFDSYLFTVWAVCTGLGLRTRNIVEIPKSLAVIVYFMLVIVESVRVYLASHKHFTQNVTRLAWFLMISLMLQIPLVSFFSINPFLLPTPLETTLHIFILIATTIECGLSIASVVLAISQAQKKVIPPRDMNDVTIVPHDIDSATILEFENKAPLRVRCSKPAQGLRNRVKHGNRRTRSSKLH